MKFDDSGVGSAPSFGEIRVSIGSKGMLATKQQMHTHLES
jgi:hypothetical protein